MCRSMAENVADIREKMARAALAAGRSPSEVLLCAACKTRTVETVRESAALPIDLFGENHVQELVEKTDAGAYLGKPGHFIGHLQTNKVKFVVGRVDLIHSVDSPRLLEAIDKQAEKLSLVQDILVEVNIGDEESKGGCPVAELPALVDLARKAKNVRLRGLMCIPPVAETPEDNRRYFMEMRQLFVDTQNQMGDNETELDCLSMGMSGDFEEAVRQGATHVRVGTALFGARPPMRKM